jgi:hypothetical protein
MRYFLCLVSAALIVGACQKPRPRQVRKEKAMERVMVDLAASSYTGCEVEMDFAREETKNGITSYPGTACKEKVPIVVICQMESDTPIGPAKACRVIVDKKSPPPDQVTSGESEKIMALLAPCRVRALNTYPDAKQRFLKGLPLGQDFSVYIPLKDDQSRVEMVFLAVEKIEGTKIHGKINNEIVAVSGYQYGQAYSIDESEILDWVIVRVDGTEEGNLSGKFLEAYQAQGEPPKGICDPID